jgi:hypothetical protein
MQRNRFSFQIPYCVIKSLAKVIEVAWKRGEKILEWNLNAQDLLSEASK